MTRWQFKVPHGPWRSANLLSAPTNCSYSGVFWHVWGLVRHTMLYKGVWVAAERRWWHTTTESESVLTHSEKRSKTRGKRRTEKRNAQQCDITGRSSSPQSTRMYREEPERQKYTEWFVQKKISSMHKSFLDFYSPKRQKWGFVSWHVSESDMLAWFSTV